MGLGLFLDCLLTTVSLAACTQFHVMRSFSHGCCAATCENVTPALPDTLMLPYSRAPMTCWVMRLFCLVFIHSNLASIALARSSPSSFHHAVVGLLNSLLAGAGSPLRLNEL